MLATLVPEPFHRPGWVYEEKYDGYRILAYKEGRKVTLFSRNAKDRTASFADVAGPLSPLKPEVSGVPAKTVMMPLGSTRRMTLRPSSAM